MAEKNEPKSPAAEKPAKHHSMPLMAIIGIVLILNLLIVGKVFMGAKTPAHGSGTAKETEEVGKKMPLEEFLVNLADPGGEHYLKATIALGLRKDVDDKKLEEELPPIKDAIISVLSAATQSGISTEPGKEKLKEDLKARINKRLGGQKVVEVYFTAFATQ